MIAVMLNELVSVLSTASIVAAEDESGSLTWLLALGPAGAGGVYFGLWRYYRNTHTSHSFERETRIEAQPIAAFDAKVDKIKGTRSSSINGDNRTNHRQRVQRFD